MLSGPGELSVSNVEHLLVVCTVSNELSHQLTKWERCVIYLTLLNNWVGHDIWYCFQLKNLCSLCVYSVCPPSGTTREKCSINRRGSSRIHIKMPWQFSMLESGEVMRKLVRRVQEGALVKVEPRSGLESSSKFSKNTYHWKMRPRILFEPGQV